MAICSSRPSRRRWPALVERIRYRPQVRTCDRRCRSGARSSAWRSSQGRRRDARDCDRNEPEGASRCKPDSGCERSAGIVPPKPNELLITRRSAQAPANAANRVHQHDPAIACADHCYCAVRFRHVMSNSFGFGGNNAVLSFRTGNPGLHRLAPSVRFRSQSRASALVPWLDATRTIEAPLLPSTITSDLRPGTGYPRLGRPARRLGRCCRWPSAAYRSHAPEPRSESPCHGHGLAVSGRGRFIGKLITDERERCRAFPNRPKRAGCPNRHDREPRMNSAPTAGESPSSAPSAGNRNCPRTRRTMQRWLARG